MKFRPPLVRNRLLWLRRGAWTTFSSWKIHFLSRILVHISLERFQPIKADLEPMYALCTRMHKNSFLLSKYIRIEILWTSLNDSEMKKLCARLVMGFSPLLSSLFQVTSRRIGAPDLLKHTITQKMANQGRFDLDVVFTMILCATNVFIW